MLLGYTAVVRLKTQMPTALKHLQARDSYCDCLENSNKRRRSCAPNALATNTNLSTKVVGLSVIS
jgi:hypothetical protein